MADPYYQALEVAASATGDYTFDINGNRQVQLGVVENGTGAVYNIIAYLANSSESGRVKHTIETGVTANYIKTGVSGFAEVGIEVTTGSTGGTIDVEVREIDRLR